MSPHASPNPPNPWRPGDEPDLDRTVAYRVPRAAANESPTVRLPSWTDPEEIGFATVPGSPAPPPGRGRLGRGWILALVAAVLVGVVGGGGVWAASKLSGGGTQPQDVLPANAMAYVRLDLDPSAGQKLALFGIARKFSATRDAFGGDDPRKALVTALQQDEPGLSKVDYARDVEPWLGDRAGLAVLPADGGGDPVGALAVQVKDEAAARTGIAKMGLGDGKGGLAFRDGYAVIATSQKLADEYVKAAPLSGEPRFAADLDALGEPGVLSFWMDVEKVADAGWSEVAATPVLQQIRGMRFAGALRFSGDYAELAGITRGGTATQGRPEPVRIGELPASTVAAASVSGLGDLLREQWPSVESAASGSGGAMVRQVLDEARTQYGLSLPDDLATLLGRTLTLALDEQDLDGALPRVGAVLTTDTAKARDVVDRLKGHLNGMERSADIATAEGDGRFVIASTQEYADALNGGGSLGESETFRLAVPDAANATYAVYADLDRLEKLYLDGLKGQERADVEQLRAVGLSGTHGEDGSTFTLRVVFD
ncbi:Protein of unknown function [Microbispora rosea]|uniref:DUF3352 domain-containing protein n=1 Tax=Microbispora rosea TaxID=58117 RepID=A0A1N7ACF9_9ACTN|nr:DUF3352 domain-containing protein [Microbispora rosea]GIH48134.1 hypothetical protein Mro03_33130 [Microbispora rosea subsp. rosea]SIR36860.1 Protein of unknown function [Microbispora rosea]